MKYSLIILLIFFCSFTYGQISELGEPYSFSHNVKIDIDKVVMPKINNADEQLNANSDCPQCKSLQFAETFAVNYNLNNSGTWQTLSNGDKLWRLAIKSENAYSINLIFETYYLPVGAKLFIYNKEKTHIIGAFTHKNNKYDKILPTMPVKGDEIIVEYYEPKNVEFSGELSISQVAHDYIGIFKYLQTKDESFGTSGDCNVNVNCEEGDDWQFEKRSVCRIMLDGYSLCTGSLINNTRFDGKPYFFTSEHCISNQTEASNLVFIFNYESPTCENVDGSVNQSIAGAFPRTIADNTNLDFCLLEMSTIPPQEYQPFYAGWTIDTQPAENTTCIHHPRGDVKKITKDYDAPLTSNNVWGYIDSSHWHITEWELGTTEPGSSGSPLYNENHQIIGNLTGGDAYCGNNVNDYYAKFSLSWDAYPTANQQLKYFLDPDTTNIESLIGYDPYNAQYQTDIEFVEIISPSRNYCIADSIEPVFIIRNKGENNIDSVIICYQLNQQEPDSIMYRQTLKTNDTDTIYFDKVELLGNFYTLKTYTTKPNNISDDNNLNDTLSFDFEVYTATPQPEIIPITKFCENNLVANYCTNFFKTYNWSVSGGIILNEADNDTISVLWDFDFDKSIDLQVTDECGMNNSDGYIPEKSSAVISLTIQTDNAADEISWEFRDDDYKILYSGGNYENNTTIIESFCIDINKCYNFCIYDAGNNGLCCDNGKGNVILFNLTHGYIISQFNSYDSHKFINFCTEPISVDEISSSEIKIYPNPTNNVLKIESEAQNIVQVEIYDIYGQLIITNEPKNRTSEINLANLNKGLYIVKIYFNNSIISRTIIKN